MDTSETLEARNKIGSREKKREGGGGGGGEEGVFHMANKQVETGVQRHRKTSGQWGGLCSSCKVVWETLRPGWEVFSRETEGERQKKNLSTSQANTSRLQLSPNAAAWLLTCPK